jgi:hypothetical protein
MDNGSFKFLVSSWMRKSKSPPSVFLDFSIQLEPVKPKT